MGGRKRAGFVAVVEDDVGVRRAVLELLKSCDIPARGFSSAEQFLKSRARLGAACVMVDMRLPGMTGLALLQALQGQGVRIPAICSTAEPDSTIKLAAATADKDMHFVDTPMIRTPKEAEAGTVSVRLRSKGDLGPKPLSEMIDALQQEIESRAIH